MDTCLLSYIQDSNTEDPMPKCSACYLSPFLTYDLGEVIGFHVCIKSGACAQCQPIMSSQQKCHDEWEEQERRAKYHI